MPVDWDALREYFRDWGSGVKAALLQKKDAALAVSAVRRWSAVKRYRDSVKQDFQRHKEMFIWACELGDSSMICRASAECAKAASDVQRHEDIRSGALADLEVAVKRLESWADNLPSWSWSLEEQEEVVVRGLRKLGLRPHEIADNRAQAITVLGDVMHEFREYGVEVCNREHAAKRAAGARKTLKRWKLS